MPKGIPNKKPEAGQISKMEALRRALAEMGWNAKPVEYQAFVKSKFGIDMETDMISNYKSTLRKETPKKAAVTVSPAPKAQAAPTVGGFKLDELEQVKALADKIGAEKVRQLAQVLAKKGG